MTCRVNLFAAFLTPLLASAAKVVARETKPPTLTRLDVFADKLAGRAFAFLAAFGIVEPGLIRAALLRVFLLVTVYVTYRVTAWALYSLFPSVVEWCLMSVPTITVELAPLESSDSMPAGSASQSKDLALPDPKRPGKIQCWDPSTGCRLGEVAAMTEKVSSSASLFVKSAHMNAHAHLPLARPS